MGARSCLPSAKFLRMGTFTPPPSFHPCLVGQKRCVYFLIGFQLVRLLSMRGLWGGAGRSPLTGCGPGHVMDY